MDALSAPPGMMEFLSAERESAPPGDGVPVKGEGMDAIIRELREGDGFPVIDGFSVHDVTTDPRMEAAGAASSSSFATLLRPPYDGMDADQYIENLRTKVRMLERQKRDMLTILKKATGVPSKPSRTKLSYITVDTMQAWAVKLVAYDACLAPITDPEGDMIEKMIGHGQRRTDDRGSGYVRSLSQREEDKKEGAMPYGLNSRDFAWIWKRAMYGIRDSPDGGPPTLNPPLNRQDGNWKMLLSNTFLDARDCGEDREIGDLCFDILVSERFEMPQEEEEEEYDEY